MIVALTHSPRLAEITLATSRIAIRGFVNDRTNSESAVVRWTAAGSFGPAARRRTRASSVVKACSGSSGFSLVFFDLLRHHEVFQEIPSAKTLATGTSAKCIAFVKDEFHVATLGGIKSQLRRDLRRFHIRSPFGNLYGHARARTMPNRSCWVLSICRCWSVSPPAAHGHFWQKRPWYVT